jgi:hypothetical protein
MPAISPARWRRRRLPEFQPLGLGHAGIGLERQAIPAPSIVDEYVEPTERGDDAGDDVSAIILAGDIGRLRPSVAWMAATSVAGSSGKRDAVMVTAASAAGRETAMARPIPRPPLVLWLRRLIPDHVSKPQHKLLSLLVFRADAWEPSVRVGTLATMAVLPSRMPDIASPAIADRRYRRRRRCATQRSSRGRREDRASPAPKIGAGDAVLTDQKERIRSAPIVKLSLPWPLLNGRAVVVES